MVAEKEFGSRDGRMPMSAGVLYQDDEGDEIRLASDGDLQEAVVLARVQKWNCLRLRVDLNAGPVVGANQSAGNMTLANQIAGASGSTVTLVPTSTSINSTSTSIEQVSFVRENAPWLIGAAAAIIVAGIIAIGRRN